MTGNDDQPTGSLFERCVTRREMLLATGGALAGILLVGCAGGEEEQQAEVQNKVYFGWLLTETSDMAAVAFDVAPPRRRRSQGPQGLRVRRPRAPRRDGGLVQGPRE